mmetsp:Transcript_55998/g.137274  ORF Transcript_55998/g.137274 Transcript_55998/m.137274 type:complete len:218 (-) Transcript_55998:264-917(-)
MPILPPGATAPGPDGSNLHPEADAIVEEHRADIVAFHAAVEGKLVAVHDLFNVIAAANGKPPMPPPAIAFLVGLKPDQQAGPEGPIIDAEQLMGAFKKMVPAKDDKSVFDEKVVSHIRDNVSRLKFIETIWPDMKDDLTAFHAKVEGNSDKLFAWFKDLLPEGAPDIPKDYFLGAMMRVPPTETTVPLGLFLAGIKSNMDETDTAEKFKEVCKKHMT